MSPQPAPEPGKAGKAGKPGDPRIVEPALNEGTQLLWLIGQAYRLSRRRMEQVVREHGITLAQFGILYSLAEEPGLSGIEVADRAFITPQAAHAAVTTLERKGLVERVEESAHRRMVRAALTDEGARVVTACMAEIRDLGVELAEGLTPDTRRGLIRLLGDFVDSKS
jgi:DNA-binding MarR family transcriptional regulator